MKPVLYPSNDVPSLTWAEIDLGALAHNYRELRRVTRSSATMMAVVKADGYGHGAPQVAGVALENGAEFLAVARLNEAIMQSTRLCGDSGLSEYLGSPQYTGKCSLYFS